MTSLPIHITTHHLSLSDSLRLFARKKIAAVTRFANDALGAEIVLRRHNGAATRFSASARIALPGRDIHGRAVHSNLYVAIGKLVAKLARLARKRKTRLAKSFNHPARVGTSSEVALPTHVQEVLPELSDMKRRPRAEEGGQEMRVFSFRRKGRRCSFAPYPSVEEFRRQDISSAGITVTRRGERLCLIACRLFFCARSAAAQGMQGVMTVR